MIGRGIFTGVIGLWLIIAGVIGFAHQGWNDLVMGVTIAILGLSMVDIAPIHSGLATLFGLWLIVAAFVPTLHVGYPLLTHNLICGIVVAAVGFTLRGVKGRAENQDVQDAA